MQQVPLCVWVADSDDIVLHVVAGAPFALLHLGCRIVMFCRFLIGLESFIHFCVMFLINLEIFTLHHCRVLCFAMSLISS